MSQPREYDIVLWGATGVTGTLVAEYLATAPTAASVRWAIAGRNRAKLDALAAELGLDGVGVVVANADDADSLAALARTATVVCSTVGPYAQYGSKLVAACVAERAHYCDLTGEVPWVREMIDAHHDAAAASATRIVHCCGFDSIPSDLGVLMMHQAMTERGLELARVDAFAGETKGTASGGTVASLLGVVDRAKRDTAVRRVLRNPYSLDPRDADRGPDEPEAKGVGYDRRLGRWTAPFVMAAINTRVVRRSNAIAGYPYGTQFRYTERQSMAGGAAGLVKAVGLTGGLAAFIAATQVPALRSWLETKLPKPGDGPDRDARESGYFVMRHIGESADSPPVRLFGRVAHDKDPGYGSTAVMLSEAALCLARDELSSPGGVLTPASAMGTALIDRLREAGMTWTVSDAP